MERSPAATSTAAVIVAAGRGTRFGGEPKQWRSLMGRRVVDHAVAAFREHPRVDEVVVVLHPDDMSRVESVATVEGGATRGASVRAGIEATRAARVLIHDAARPLVSRAVIDRVLAALDAADGAAPALPVTDALWSGGAFVEGARDRAGLWRAQTPQGFGRDAILAAHRAHPGGAADDVEVARAAGLAVAIVEGDEDNLKITRPGDLERAERILRTRGAAMDVRTGNGFDVHRLGPGGSVTLCGVASPHDRALIGHSDADVGWHALTDAILGALGSGDIGRHFPPSDPQWRGADSGALPAPRLRARGRGRLAAVASRPHADLRAAEDHAARARDDRAHGGGRPPRRGRRQRQGHDLRGLGLSRPRGGHRRDGHRDPGASVTGARLVATVGGIGLLRPAPGTWGSAAAIPAAWLLHGVGGYPAAGDRGDARC